MIRPVLEDAEAPAAKAALCLVAGIWAGAWSVEGEEEGAALIGACLAGLILIRARGGRRLAFVMFWLSLGFLLGRLQIAVPAEEAEAAFRVLPDTDSHTDVVEGVLTDFWSGRPPRARSALHAERLLVRGRWRDFPAEVVVFVSGETPVVPMADRGDRVRVTGRLEREDLPASERELPLPWARFRVSVKSALLVEKRETTFLSWLTLPNRFLFSRLPDPGVADPAFERDVRGPLAALLLGRTSELDRGMVARYRRGGLYHVLVVSGLHVVLAAGLVLALLGFLGVEGKPRDLVLVLSVFLFVLVGGANPPAVRAGLVVAVLLLTRLVERPISAAQAIGLSALLLFLASPVQIWSVGTILTFAAVCGIALFARPIRQRFPERPEWLWGGLAATLAAEAATAPVLFWRFNLVAAGAWLTTPVAIPLSGVLIVLGAGLLALYAVGLPAEPIAGLFALGSRALEELADRAAGVAYLRPTPPLWGVAMIALLLAAAALGPPRLRSRLALGAGALFLLLVLRRDPGGPARGFSVEALDVGQGDAILLRWGRHAILVDGGGPFDRAATDFGRTRVLPKLLDRGVTKLDAVLLTHPHPDHALGLFAVLEELPVGVLWRSSAEDEGDLYLRLEEIAARRRVPVRRLDSGEEFDLSGLHMSVVHAGGPRRKHDAVNNQSVVMLAARDGRRALLTGDVGAPVEEDLARQGRLEAADLLKVAHHGSRTSTTPRFLDAICPRAAVLSCGRRNRFGHPAPETLRALARADVPVLRTDLRSDIRVELLPDATRLSWRGIERP